LGEVVELWSSDQGSRRDIPFWVQKAGHRLLGVFEEEGYARFLVEKAR
jgi:TusA-related sulfurtransferase